MRDKYSGFMKRDEGFGEMTKRTKRINPRIIYIYVKIMQWEELKIKLEQAQSIAIFGHQSIDGDAIWSMYGLWLQLEKLWKKISWHNKFFARLLKQILYWWRIIVKSWS